MLISGIQIQLRALVLAIQIAAFCEAKPAQVLEDRKGYYVIMEKVAGQE
jgi:hypothetical protein